MSLTDASAGRQSAFDWKVYSVRRSEKQLLLSFITEALELRGCHVVHASDPGQAPFYIVFETPAGERHGLLAYAFLANYRHTRNRPKDEHRFQIKYGGNLKGILEVAVDPLALVTTVFLGIDTERRIFVAADPLMNTPAPMSRSIEFKRRHVDRILDQGWATWERDRRPAKTRSRPAFQLEEDVRTEILVGGRQERLLDLIGLERIALGFDPGERHLVAEKLMRNPPRYATQTSSHGLLRELEIEPETLFGLIEGASRLKMAVRGWVAESHLEDELKALPQVSHCERLEGDGQPDISLRWKGGPPILIECKNTLRETYSDGRPKVDFQRTRASKADPCSRYYSPTEFQVLAACLHAVTERWEFRFARTVDLPKHKTCEGRIMSAIAVANPLFTTTPESVLDRCGSLSS